MAVSELASAGANAGVDLLKAYWQKKATEDAAKAYARENEKARQEIRLGYQDVAGLYDPYMQQGQVALNDLVNMTYDPTQYQMPEDFQFQGTVQDYLDPSMAYQQEQMQRGIESSAVAQGGLMSGATLKALQDRSAQLAQTDYGNAFNRQQQERGNAYQEYLNKFNMERQLIGERYKRLGDITSMGFGATQGTANARFGGASQISQNFQGGASVAGYGATAPYTMGGQVVDAVTSPAMINSIGNMFGGGQQASINNMPSGYTSPAGTVYGSPSQGNTGLDLNSQMNLNRMMY